jgi:hypothetical protein
MALSAANAVQAKTGHVQANSAPVALDNPTGDGNTVTIEIAAGGVPFMDGGMAGRVPDGWAFDACSMTNASRIPHVFRKQVFGGESSWSFDYLGPCAWHWRVTEWDQALEPVSPLDGFASNFDLGTGVTTLSTGTTSTTGRSDVVCLAWHQWQRATNTAQAMTFSGHTNGFTVRDELRYTEGTAEFAPCWSWAFGAGPGPFESTATVNLATRDAADIYVGLVVVYAATTYG